MFAPNIPGDSSGTTIGPQQFAAVDFQRLLVRRIGLADPLTIRLLQTLALKRPLGVRFPKAKLDTLGTPTILVEHHPRRARMHGIMPIEPTDRIKYVIRVIDTKIINANVGFILASILGHGLLFSLID
jgi:hypothetical protein